MAAAYTGSENCLGTLVSPLVNGDELIRGEQHVEFDLHFLLWGEARTWKEMAGTNQRERGRAEKESGKPTQASRGALRGHHGYQALEG